MASKVNIVINGKNLASKAIKEVTGDLSAANTAGQKFGSTMSSIAKFGIGTAIAGFGASLAGFFTSVQKDAAWEQTSIKFETLIGDATKAKSVLSDLQKFSASTPLSFESISDGAINLMAFGTQAEDVQNEMRMIGDLAMGDSDKLSRLVQAYGKLQSKGKASLEEINRFTEAGVPLLDQLATNLNTSTAEVNAFISSGKIGFADVQEALRDLTSEGGQFAGMLEKQADSVNGKWSTFKDTISLATIKVGEALRPLSSSLLDTAIDKLNSFMESDTFNTFIDTTVRWASWAVGILPKIGAVFTFIGEVISITAKHAFDELDNLKNIVFETPVVQFLFELGGDGYEAIKKGFESGDWSDAFGVGSDIIKTGFVIFASVKIGSEIASTLWTSLQLGMKSSKFLTGISGIGVAGVIAGASIAVGLVEAESEGDWTSFGNNLTAAIAGGFIAAGLTQSPQAGIWTASILFNVGVSDLLENLPDPEETADEIKKFFKDVWDMTGLEQWWSETGTTIGQNFIDSIKQVISLFDIVGAFVDLWNNYGTKVVSTIKGWFSFDTKSEGEVMGENIATGLIDGLENSDADKKSKSWWEKFLDTGKAVLGIHSPSKEAREMGEFFVEGFYEGLTDSTWTSQINEAWKRMMTSLNAQSTIDVGGVLSDIKGTDGNDDPPPSENTSGFSKLWSSMKSTANDSQLGSLFSSFGPTLNTFISGLGSTVTSLASFQAILNPLSTILSAAMDVLGPVIDSVLSPLVGILNIFGKTIGQVLTPVIQWLTPIITLIGEVFVWLYNKILIPIGNGLITVFNAVGIGLTTVVNGVISAINWALGWAGVNLNKVAVPNIDDGQLSAITATDLTAAGSSYIGGGSGSGVSGSSTSVQSYTIEVHQTVQGNVIGEGGMEQIGRFFVEAVEAYLGSGGKVSFVQG